MNKQERIFELEEAVTELDQVIDKIYQALRGTEHESHADAYILGHLRGWIDGGGGYDVGITQYIKMIEDSRECKNCKEVYDKEELYNGICPVCEDQE